MRKKQKNISIVSLISEHAKTIRKKDEPWTRTIQRASKELKSKGALKGIPPSKQKRKTYGLIKSYGLKGVKQVSKLQIIPKVELTFNTKDKITGAIGSAAEVAELISKFFPKNTIGVREQFFVIYLNTKNKIIGVHKHSVGGINNSIVDMRILFSIALKSLSSQIIVAHNHPSGGLKPSLQDLRITKQIASAGKLLQIDLLDHVIITEDDYYSFAEEGKL